MFQKLVQLFLQRFVQSMGREPMTPAEWMEIQDQAVRHLNKTKGAPSIKKRSVSRLGSQNCSKSGRKSRN